MIGRFFKGFLLVGAVMALALPCLTVPCLARPAAAADGKTVLYKQLMELNGMSRNVRQVITNTKINTRQIVVERASVDHLTTDQEAQYSRVADSVLLETQAQLIESIATAQAPNFSQDEIQQLIDSNSSVAAAKYNAAKFFDPEQSTATIQTYMVNAVLKIIKIYQDSTGDSSGVAINPINNNDNAQLSPEVLERKDMARTVFRVDGSDTQVRHLVGTEHMKLIIQEVANHIDINALSESDKYRLAAIAGTVQTELEDAILDQMARVQASALTRSELASLIVAYDNDAQRKLTQMRLNDDGRLDKAAELDIQLAQYQIVKAFEAGT